MTTPNTQVLLSADLRRRAEEHVRTTDEALSAMFLEDVQRVVQELQVHQIKLEMQNEELRKSQLELEVSRDEKL